MGLSDCMCLSTQLAGDLCPAGHARCTQSCSSCSQVVSVHSQEALRPAIKLLILTIVVAEVTWHSMCVSVLLQEDLDEEKFPEGFSLTGSLPQATAEAQGAGTGTAGDSARFADAGWHQHRPFTALCSQNLTLNDALMADSHPDCTAMLSQLYTDLCYSLGALNDSFPKFCSELKR